MDRVVADAGYLLHSIHVDCTGDVGGCMIICRCSHQSGCCNGDVVIYACSSDHGVAYQIFAALCDYVTPAQHAVLIETRC